MYKLKMSVLKVAASLFTIFIFLAGSTNVALAGSDGNDCLGESPLPKYKIKAPASNVPKEVANFSGVWIGMWEDGIRGGLCHTLVVTRVKANGRAKVIYSTGVYPPWNLRRGSYGRFSGKIKEDELSFKLRNGILVTYRLVDNELEGTYGGRTYGSFKRIKN